MTTSLVNPNRDK